MRRQLGIAAIAVAVLASAWLFYSSAGSGQAAEPTSHWISGVVRSSSGEPLEGVQDIHTHPAVPRTVRFTLSVGF